MWSRKQARHVVREPPCLLKRSTGQVLSEREKVYFRSQILERPSIGEYWNISGVTVLPANVTFSSLERAGGIQKQTILERKNGLV